MAEDKEEKPTTQNKKKEGKEEETLPFCTTAPSAEHSRGAEEDDACYDYREGDYEREDEKE